MRRIISRRRIAALTVAFLLLATGSAILLRGRTAHAFTLINATIFFDPISVPSGSTLHVHVVNQLGTAPIGIFPSCKPTTPTVGSSSFGTAAPLAPGDGSDQSFTFASFSPPPATTRIPVVCKIDIVALGGGVLPFDFSGRTASSVEITDDATGKPTAILATHHVVSPVGPCLFCN